MNLPRRKMMVLLFTMALIFYSFLALLPNETLFVSAQSSVSAPTFSPAEGTYSSPQTVTITCDTPASVIRYTIDGSEPSNISPLYRKPILVSSTTTIKAKAYVSLVTGMIRSDTASATFTIEAVEKVATPTFSPAGGSFSGSQSVAIQCATPGATIRFTTSGDEPSSSSTVYSDPIVVTTNTTIKAKAFFAEMTDSDTASATYAIIEEEDPQEPFAIGTEVYAVIAVVAVVAALGIFLIKKRR